LRVRAFRAAAAIPGLIRRPASARRRPRGWRRCRRSRFTLWRLSGRIHRYTQRPGAGSGGTGTDGMTQIAQTHELSKSIHPRARPLVDPFERAITYLRVSVTDRCDFRCVYCMSEHMTFLPKADLLTLEELDRLCSAFIARGGRKRRLTGGDPLVRRGIMTLVGSLARHLTAGSLDELTLTTNGSQLPKYAAELAACGVQRINVSLDTLDADKFRAITRWGELDKVLAGIAAAQATG